MKAILQVGVAAGTAALILGLGAAGESAELRKLVENSDLIFVGQVTKVTQGQEKTLNDGSKFRLDTATLFVIEMLWGDPDLRQVEVDFAGLPAESQPKLSRRQSGIWLLTKSDRKNAYEIKSRSRLLPTGQLGAVRRTIRAVTGLTGDPVKPEDRAARVQRLRDTLASKKPNTTRRLAAYRLGELGDLAALPTLIGALQDDAPSIRFAADIAIRRITGHRIQTDFHTGTPAARERGVQAWRDWLAAHRGKTRQEILTAAAAASARPQPDFEYAIEGLATCNDPSLRPLFVRTFDAAVGSKNNVLVTAAVQYFARIRDRSSVPRLAALLDPNQRRWSSTSTRAAAATAIGLIVRKDFGAGQTAIDKCRVWWDANKGTFR